MASQRTKTLIHHHVRRSIVQVRTLLTIYAVVVSLHPLSAKSNPSVGELAHFVVQVHASKAGSGVIVESADGYTTVLTARHLIKGTHLEENPTVTTVDGVIHNITSVSMSSFLDLAELRINGEGYAVPKLLPTFKGGLVRIIGFPNRTGKLTAANGIAETPGTTPRVREGGYGLRHNAKTEDGYSGSGVFDSDGNLVGIHGQSDLLVSSSGEKYRSSSGQAIPIQFWIQARNQGGLDNVSSTNYPAPSTATDFSLMGSELLSTGSTAEALALFEKAESLEPEEVAHLGNQATALIALKRFHEALKVLNRAILKDPENSSLRLVRANSSYELGSDIEALNDLNWVIDVASNHPIALQNRAQVLLRLNRLEESEKDLSLAIPHLANPISPLRLRAKIRLLRKQNDLAMEDLNQILIIDDSDAADWVNRARLFMQMGNLEAARYDLRAALSFNMNDPFANKAMGILEVMSGNQNAAIPLLELAIKFAPTDPEAHAYLGAGYFKSGELIKACGEFRQATTHGQKWDMNEWDSAYLAACK